MEVGSTPPIGGGDAEGRIGGGGGIQFEETKYGWVVYYNTSNYRPLQGSGAEAG